MAILTLTASTVLGLRRAVLKTVLAHLPQEEGMTKTALAESLGMTRARLHALENNRVEQFSLDALVALAMRLGLTVRMSMTRPYTREG